ncbi:MAG TPA: glycosyltransferase family 4 protein [Candidatus Acidoferrales bacterium]
MTIKLLMYSHDWFPVVGGVQTVTRSLAIGLAQWGQIHPGKSFEVVFVTQTPANGMDDSRLPFPVVRRPGLRDLIRRIRAADVLHLAGPALLPQLLAWLLRTPTVIEHHGYQSVCANGLLLYAPEHSTCPSHFMNRRYQKCVECNARDLGWTRSFRSLLMTFPRRWLCQRAASNIAVSDHVAMRIALPRTRTIYHGIYDPASAPRNRASEDGSALRLGYVGRLVREKGLLLLLDAASQLQKRGVSFHLTFVGDGPQRTELEATSQRLGLPDYVTFAGELQGADFESALRAIQVVVMPSQCEETAGLAAMEQMIRGGVVVAADIGGLSEIVGDAGLKFLKNDSAALAARLHQIHENPSLIESLGVAAHSRATELFNLDTMVEQHAGLYEEVIRK